MRRLACAIVFSLSASVVYSSGADTENVQWNAGQESGSSTTLTEILIRAALRLPQIYVHNLTVEDIVSDARCSATFVRPGVGRGPFLDGYNELNCVARTTQGKAGSLRMDLSEIPVHRYGNSFAPRGVAIKGETAKVLVAVMEEYYQNLGPDAYFDQKMARLSSKDQVYEFVDYTIAQLPYDPLSPKNLVCSKEWSFAVGAEKPVEPSYIRCVFTYMDEYKPAAEEKTASELHLVQ